MPVVSSAHNNSQIRLFEECMYGERYRLIGLPEGYGPELDEANEKFDRRKIVLELIEDDKIDELVAWEDAKNSGNLEQLRSYLKAYPDGYFTSEARKLISDGPPKNLKSLSELVWPSCKRTQFTMA